MKLREAWYIGKVPEKQNRSWSTSDKLKVYTMMTEEHRSASEIAMEFNASKTQIYNVVRLVRKGIRDECYICGDPLNAEEISKNSDRLVKACKKCRKKSEDHKKELRRKAARKGLCIYCGTRKALPGHKSCSNCVSATHRRRYAQGLCGHCGVRPIGKNRIALCDECAEKSKIRTTIYRHKVKHEA